MFKEYFSSLKIPPGWRVVDEREDGKMWLNAKRRLSVIASVSKEQDGRQWLHISVAHPRCLPRYEDLKYIKRHWAGPERKAVQIFAPESEHVNIHPHCLHLFCSLEDDPLPDFTWGTGII